MRQTNIFECSKCGGLLLSNQKQKTRCCPYCGVRIDLQKAKPIATAENAFEASEMLRTLKTKRQSNPGRSETK